MYAALTAVSFTYWPTVKEKNGFGTGLEDIFTWRKDTVTIGLIDLNKSNLGKLKVKQPIQ